MIENVRQLFKVVVDKVGDSSRVRILKGSSNSGSYPSLPGLLEAQNEEYMSLRTASADLKGIFTGMGFLLGGYGFCLFALIFLSSDVSSIDWWLLFYSILAIVLPLVWETSRPPSLPIIFNRRTQEIYYDRKGQLYHAIWEGIEAAAYEYNMVNHV